MTLTGTRGSPPPADLKVALNMLGGYRNTMTMVITGLDIEAKAEHAGHLLFERLGGPAQFEEADVRLLRFDRPDAPANELATAHLRVTVKDQDERKVGRAFSDAITELALAGYAGFHTTTPPAGASAYGVYWPALVPARVVTQYLHLPDGSTMAVRANTLIPPPGPAPGRAGSRTPARRPGRRRLGGLGGQLRRPPEPAQHRAASRSRSRSAGCAAPGPATRAATRTWACGRSAPPPTPGCAGT